MSGYAAGISWRIRPEELANGVRRYGARLVEMLRVVVGHYRLLMESWARQNAPWTDRTGHARQGLHATGDVYGEGRGHVGVLRIAHGVEYGIWLELAHAGRWGIIQRTLDEFEGRVIQTIREQLA